MRIRKGIGMIKNENIRVATFFSVALTAVLALARVCGLATPLAATFGFPTVGLATFLAALATLGVAVVAVAVREDKASRLFDKRATL